MNYIPHSDEEIKGMLEFIGISSIDELFTDIPCEALYKQGLKLGDSMSELDLRRHFEELSSKNRRYSMSFLGAGSYRHFVPSIVKAVISRSEFYTAYTPYQAEASQGTLQAIFEFQSYMCMLTGMDVSNASLYDGSTAMAEAAILSLNETRRKKILVSEGVHPEYREVLWTYLGSSAEIVEMPLLNGITDLSRLKGLIDRNTAAVILQNPNFLGCIEPGLELSESLKDSGALFVVVVVEPVSLGLLKSPGRYGADIVAGECQSLGLPPSFGGPGLGFMATRGKYMRKIPGRLCGKTLDKNGKEGFVLTLQAREQHIRREKASSNICTNEALCALAATVYLSVMGRCGFREAAIQNARKAHYALKTIGELSAGRRKFSTPVFNEFVVEFGEKPSVISEALEEAGIQGGFELGRFYPDLGSCMLINVTEMTRKEDIDELVKVLKRVETGERILTRIIHE